MCEFIVFIILMDSHNYTNETKIKKYGIFPTRPPSELMNGI